MYVLYIVGNHWHQFCVFLNRKKRALDKTLHVCNINVKLILKLVQKAY